MHIIAIALQTSFFVDDTDLRVTNMVTQNALNKSCNTTKNLVKSTHLQKAVVVIRSYIVIISCNKPQRQR